MAALECIRCGKFTAITPDSYRIIGLSIGSRKVVVTMMIKHRPVDSSGNHDIALCDFCVAAVISETAKRLQTEAEESAKLLQEEASANTS